jgi:type IV pilus assembly protein PilC
MLFRYQVIDKEGNQISGSIDAASLDIAISSLQKRGFIVSSIRPANKNDNLLGFKISFGGKIKLKDIVLLSKQLSTLFEAQVSALRIFRLLGADSDNPAMRMHLSQIADEIQGGLSISAAMARHPQLFSEYYVSMVQSGEESGRLPETFAILAEDLERTYLITSKAKHALVYPTFVVITFIGVMALMLTTVIPKLTVMIKEAGQDIPIYTKVVMFISEMLVSYGVFVLLALVLGGIAFWRWIRTPEGKFAFDKFKISIPYFGNLFRKLYLARITSNLNTMLSSAIPIVKALELTSKVVENAVYERVISESLNAVKSGQPLSRAFQSHEEMPKILVAMMKVGEETGNSGEILKTLSRFYEREVNEAVDAIVGLIEPVMVVALGIGVGFLLVSVLMPIYNISSGM